MTMLGLKHSEETKAKMRASAIARGDCGGAEKLRGRKRPQEVVEKCLKTAFQKGNAPWNKGKPHTKIRGDKHPNWRGGKWRETRTERHFLMQQLEYKLWRRSVFERDNYTCQMCGARSAKGKKVVLNADHIKPWALFVELRYAIDNGRTLCRSCHETTDTWGLTKPK